MAPADDCGRRKILGAERPRAPARGGPGAVNQRETLLGAQLSSLVPPAQTFCRRHSTRRAHATSPMPSSTVLKWAKWRQNLRKHHRAMARESADRPR